jgi:uncharacterized protein YbjT (DUF2867 family)
MSDKKVIAVVGATGAQGGGLVRAIQQDPDRSFIARALTRNPTSQKASDLGALGAELVAADLDDAESVKRAFSGATAAFLVTFFWEHFSPEKEIAQVHSMANAAKEAGLDHIVWSTLEDTRRWVPLSDQRMPTLMENYKVPHFDAKGEADQIFRDLRLPTTFLLTSFYWDNLIYFGMGPKRGPDGKLAFTLPMADKKLPGIASADIGKCALAIFKRGQEFVGKTVGIAGEHLTGTEMAQSLSSALGEEITYNDVPPDVFRGFGFPGAEDLGNMFQFKQEFQDVFCGARDPEFARSLNPSLQSFDSWLSQNKEQIPIE